MNVIIINGSPRTKGVTAIALHMIENNLRRNGIEVEYFDLNRINMSHSITQKLSEKS